MIFPGLINLSSWSRQSVHDWLVLELKSKYGVRPDIGAEWLNDRKLFLLLDGLDELKAELQKPCAEALNQYFSGEQAPEYIVVACRAEEYGSLKTRLQLNGAIHLKSLNNEQIKIYLTHK